MWSSALAGSGLLNNRCNLSWKRSDSRWSTNSGYTRLTTPRPARGIDTLPSRTASTCRKSSMFGRRVMEKLREWQSTLRSGPRYSSILQPALKPVLVHSGGSPPSTNRIISRISMAIMPLEGGGSPTWSCTMLLGYAQPQSSSIITCDYSPSSSFTSYHS